MAPINRHLLITGHVQGVWYRKSAVVQGLELGIKGWVRNLNDGSVEVVAEGEEEAIERFIDWCRRGPPNARVSGVLIEPGAIQGFDSFETIR